MQSRGDVLRAFTRHTRGQQQEVEGGGEGIVSDIRTKEEEREKREKTKESSDGHAEALRITDTGQWATRD